MEKELKLEGRQLLANFNAVAADAVAADAVAADAVAADAVAADAVAADVCNRVQQSTQQSCNRVRNSISCNRV